MILLSLLLTLVVKGDMFVVRYPISDSLRGMVYAPLDTIYVEDSTTLFSVSLGCIHGKISRVEDVERMIHNMYSKILPDATINVQRYIKVSIIGEVKSPQAIYINEREPLSILIALAGGPTEFENLKKIKLYRHCTHIKINYYRATETGTTLKDLDISSGDVIEVPRRFRINFSNISAAISAIILLWSFYQTNFQNN